VADGINDYNALSPEKFHRPKRVLRSFRAGMESGRWVARYPTDLTDTKRAVLALPETTVTLIRIAMILLMIRRLAAKT
jgi:hypothetical protein